MTRPYAILGSALATAVINALVALVLLVALTPHLLLKGHAALPNFERWCLTLPVFSCATGMGGSRASSVVFMS